MVVKVRPKNERTMKELVRIGLVMHAEMGKLFHGEKQEKLWKKLGNERAKELVKQTRQFNFLINNEFPASYLKSPESDRETVEWLALMNDEEKQVVYEMYHNNPEKMEKIRADVLKFIKENAKTNGEVSYESIRQGVGGHYTMTEFEIAMDSFPEIVWRFEQHGSETWRFIRLAIDEEVLLGVRKPRVRKEVDWNGVMPPKPVTEVR